MGWAIAVSALLFAAGQLPRHHPLLPGLHVAWPSAVRHALAPAPASPADVQMSGPKRMPVGSQITAAGSLPSRTSGPLVVQARWPSGGWKVLGSARVEHGGYTVRFRLRRRGVVRVRLALPDGTFARATIRVV